MPDWNYGFESSTYVSFKDMHQKLYYFMFDCFIIVFTVSSVKPHPVDNCVKMKKLWFQQSPFLKSDFRERSIKIKGTEQSKNGKLGLVKIPSLSTQKFQVIILQNSRAVIYIFQKVKQTFWFINIAKDWGSSDSILHNFVPIFKTPNHFTGPVLSCLISITRTLCFLCCTCQVSSGVE